MNKALCTLVAIIVVGLAGCAKSNHEPIARARAQQYTQLILDEKFDEAVNFVDPDMVTTKGRTEVTKQFKNYVSIVKFGVQLLGRRPAGFEVRRVDFDAEKIHASVQIVFFTTDTSGSDHSEHPADQKWVQKNKTWYVIP